MRNEKTKNPEPCTICELYMEGVECEQEECPVKKMKDYNAYLEKKVADLRLEMSYMTAPNTIGDRHEMGG